MPRRRPESKAVLLERYHACQVPGCKRRIKQWFFACLHHSLYLGYDLSVRLQTAWLEREWRAADFEAIKREALQRWGWKEEKPCPSPNA